MRHLDLFSGIGGFALAARSVGWETVGFCEIDPYCQKVLRKHWPDVPIYEDVRKLDGGTVGHVDIITGGFPCQDISTAGRQSGIAEGTRSGLWSECSRLLGEIRPTFAVFENVTNLLAGERGSWFKRVLWDISQVGYDAEWHCIPASEIGAHHHRDRVWIVVYPNKTFTERGGLSCGIQKELAHAYGRSPEWCASHNVAHPLSWRQQRQGKPFKPINTKAVENWEAAKPVNGCVGEIWQAEPRVGRVVDGVWKASYGHRLGALGNAICPQVAEVIFRAIDEVDSAQTGQRSTEDKALAARVERLEKALRKKGEILQPDQPDDIAKYWIG